MTFRAQAILNILVFAAGGAAFLTSFTWVCTVILPSTDKVGVAEIPALAGMGMVYGLVIGILRTYRHKIEQNRMAMVFSGIGFMLGGFYGFIYGISIDHNSTISSAGTPLHQHLHSNIFLAKKKKVIPQKRRIYQNETSQISNTQAPHLHI